MAFNFTKKNSLAEIFRFLSNYQGISDGDFHQHHIFQGTNFFFKSLNKSFYHGIFDFHQEIVPRRKADF